MKLKKKHIKDQYLLVTERVPQEADIDQQSVCKNIWNDVLSNKMLDIT